MLCSIKPSLVYRCIDIYVYIYNIYIYIYNVEALVLVVGTWRDSICVFCWDHSWFSPVFRYQPVDIIQPTNHVLPASFGDSDWHIVTGNSLTATNESSRRKPSQHELEKQRMPGDYFLLFSSTPVVKTDWSPWASLVSPFPALSFLAEHDLLRQELNNRFLVQIGRASRRERV